MSRLGDRVLASVACGWLVAAGIFLFVKGLDISLIACRADACGNFGELAPGVMSFVAGVGMLIAWPYLAAVRLDKGWHKRLGVAVGCGAVVATLAAPPALALTERLGIPLWLCVALVSAIAIPPPVIARGYALQGRAVVGALLGAALVVAEMLLHGDAYVFAFAMCAALTPPAFAGVDDFAVGWQSRPLPAETSSSPSEPSGAPS